MSDIISGIIVDSSIEELEEIVLRAKEALVLRRAEDVRNALEKVREIALSVGLSLEELIQESEKETVRKKVQVKYRNPLNIEQTWTGRGKQPLWIDQLSESHGYSLEDLRV